MSEAERIRRQNYKRNRKRWMLTQAIILAVVVAMALGSFLIYTRLNKTYYIEYTESSTSDYRVHYRENTFFEEEWLEPGQSYVSELTDDIGADFHYEMHMDTSNVAFDYTYELVSQLVISDKTSGAHIYDPVEVIIPKTTKSVVGTDKFYVDESAMINFAEYNTLANQFINVYGLKNAKAALWVTLKVDVISASDEFEMNNENTHSVSMLIPLNELNFSIENMTSLPDAESKVLACKKNGNQKLFLGCSVAMGALALLLACVLVVFAYITKNEDVTYANRVRKLLNAYRSFIQRIYGEFDTEGYQIVQVKSFTELLGIRDTIQSPVLMSENKDETRTQFLIPTNTKILYLYEIRVDNYDDLYGEHPEWIDDSIVKTESDKKEPQQKADDITVSAACDVVEADEIKLDEFDLLDTDEEIEKASDESASSENDKQQRIIIDLYAEIEKLRKDMNTREERKCEPAYVPCTGGNMKFGHFSAGGDVTIHYHEMPDEFLKRAAMMFESDKDDSKDDSDKGEKASDEAVEIAEATDESETADDCAAIVVEEDVISSDSDVTDGEAVEATEEAKEATEEAALEVATEAEEAIEPVEEATEPVEEATEPAEEVAEPVEEAAEPVEEAEKTVDVVCEADANQNDDGDDDSSGDGSIVFYDENNNKLSIKCSRSCTANIIQSENETTKSFYSELKNYILSFKGVNARMSWRHESFNKGRKQLFKLKIRGKTVCMYCALDPDEFDFNKYYHRRAEAKMYENVPMLVKIKSPGALKKAKKLVDKVMERFEIAPKTSYVAEDFVAMYPYERTQNLIDRGLIKILVPEGYVVVDPRHIVKAEAMKKVLEAREARKAKLAEEKRLAQEAKLAEEARLAEEELQKSIEVALAEPDVELKDIHYVDEADDLYVASEEQPGVEVINVVWPEHARNNKLYRYDPNGEQLAENDIVLVPTRDAHKNRDVVRKATVAHGNHLVSPESITHPLKKIIRVIKHKVEEALSGDGQDLAKNKTEKTQKAKKDKK